MLELTSCLEINSDEVAAQVIDGEAIIINLSNGMYYSLNGVGGDIWSLIVEGRTLEEVAAAIDRRYQVESTQAREDVQRVVSELLDENLVRVSNGLEFPRPPEDDIDGSAERHYDTPTFHAYRDMADLLALDPPMPGVRATPWQGPDETPLESELEG